MDGLSGRGAGVPDLLFESVCCARVEELRPLLDKPELAGPGTPLHRVTVFLTYRCNLTCPYCKTIARSAAELAQSPQKTVTYDVPRFEALLARLSDMPIRHLHFTGGEAALVPNVEQMVAAARRAGIEQLSMTSNGTAPPSRYVALVAQGLREVRISIDAHEAALGAKLTGRPGAWPRSVQALRALAQARRGGADVRVLANVVVGRENRARLVELVRFLASLGPDDIKLITEVDERDVLPDFSERAAVERGLAQVLADAPPESFPLLRRKVRTVFAPDAIGLEPTAATRREGRWRCYVPLTERTVDGAAYYPCSVYLREGGAPIGSVDESAEAQRQATAAWVRDTDCREDPICRRYCLLCTRAYNDAANEASTRLNETSARLDALRDWFLAQRPPPEPAPAAAPQVLVLTPLGLSSPDTVATLLAHQVRPVERLALPGYPRASMALYTRELTEARLAKALAHHDAWHARYGDAAAEVWVLDATSAARAAALKPQLRARWPAVEHAVGGTPYLARLQRFHLPDAGDEARTWAWLTRLTTPLR